MKVYLNNNDSMSKEFIYVIGDSYFQHYSNNWLDQSLTKLQKYEVINLAKPGASFLRQWDTLENLKLDNNFLNIKYCIIGWSSAWRFYDYTNDRDWNMNKIDEYNNLKGQKKQTLKSLIKFDLWDHNIESRKGVAILNHINSTIYKSKKYSHIKFINYFCFTDFVDANNGWYYFDNQVNFDRSLYDITYKKYGSIVQDLENHMSVAQHKAMAKNLYHIIEYIEKTNTVPILNSLENINEE